MLHRFGRLGFDKNEYSGKTEGDKCWNEGKELNARQDLHPTSLIAIPKTKGKQGLPHCQTTVKRRKIIGRDETQI